MASKDAANKAKQYELSLKQAESRLQSILSSMADLVFVLDDEGRFVSYHGAPQDLYINPEVFIGKKYSDVMPAPWTPA
jgi:PAS domain-containing protein